MFETEDQELFAAGRRARRNGDCTSLIVATNPDGIRNYHNCDGSFSHKGEVHSCGCGQLWNGNDTGGPLTDVVRAGETIA